jgi:hypothetical protein
MGGGERMTTTTREPEFILFVSFCYALKCRKALFLLFIKNSTLSSFFECEHLLLSGSELHYVLGLRFTKTESVLFSVFFLVEENRPFFFCKVWTFIASATATATATATAPFKDKVTTTATAPLCF